MKTDLERKIVFPTPKKLGEILDQSFSIARKVIVASMPVLIIGALLSIADADETLKAGQTDKVRSVTEITIYIISKLAQTITSFYIYFLCIPMAGEAWCGGEPSLRSANEQLSFAKVFRLVRLWIRISIVGGLLLLLLVIPGAVYILNRYLATYPLFFEGLSIKDSISKSKALMSHGQKRLLMSETQWRASGLLIVATILSFLPSFFLGVAVASATEFGKILNYTIIAAFTFVTYLAGIYSQVAATGLYFDLRSRTEGNDLLEAIGNLRQTTE